jgi:hypothetical protein
VSEAAFSVAQTAFPEIRICKLRFREFDSDTVFFKARFSIGRYVTFRPMRYIIYYNRAAFSRGISDVALRGILAHELAHVRYYVRKNRVELIGLTGLVSDGFKARFERNADLDAIELGFGKGLAEYRRWLFLQIGEDAVRGKLIDYFSPEEIGMIVEANARDPRSLDALRRNMPGNKGELNAILRRCEGKADCGS